MPFTIRDRRPADLEACVKALAAVHRLDGYPLNWPADPGRWLDPPAMLVAWVVECPAGAIAGHVALDAVNDAEAAVTRLFVAPGHRGRALGRRLLAHAQEWAASRGLDLTLDVTDDGRRSRAVALYEQMGWVFSHTSRAEWTAPRGKPVRLRHYRYPRLSPTHKR